MQSTDYLKPTEFFWPSPEAFDDLTVEDAEEGFTLTAPDDSECGEWLAYWNQSPEHLELFTEEFTQALKNNLDSILGQDGQTENLTDGQQCNSEQA
jgi:hypothetical protein